MKRVLVYIPFHRKETDEDCKPGDEIVVSEEELARIRAVNVNMVAVLGEAEEVPEGNDEVPEDNDEVPEDNDEVPEDNVSEKPKRKSKEK
jgi:hypothetical protein